VLDEACGFGCVLGDEVSDPALHRRLVIARKVRLGLDCVRHAVKVEAAAGGYGQH
jgi:hypothetical protein